MAPSSSPTPSTISNPAKAIRQTSNSTASSRRVVCPPSIRVRPRGVPPDSRARSRSAAAHMLAAEKPSTAWAETVEAIPELKRRQSAPREPNIHFGLGYLYWKQHKYEEAEAAFKNRARHRSKTCASHGLSWRHSAKAECPDRASSPAQQSHSIAKRYPHRLPGHRRHPHPAEEKSRSPSPPYSAPKS